MFPLKRNGSIFVSLGLLKVLLNPQGGKTCYISLSLITLTNENAYKSYKNKLTHSLWVAKRLYHEKQIEKLQATWKVSNRNKGKRGLPSNPKEIANLSGKWLRTLAPI